MNDFDFTSPPSKSIYDASAALRFFESAGEMKSIKAGKKIFREKSKASWLLRQRDKMYYLLEGTVELTASKTPVGTVHAGELFGEMTLITNMPRTATARAKTVCRLLMIDKEQLQAALQTSPDFALLLMGIMVERLRNTIGYFSSTGGLPSDAMLKDAAIFDKKLLEKIAEEFDYSARMRYPADKVIMQEGQSGVFMYVVLKGSVEIDIQDSTVGRIGPGGIFGEMALISQAERLARATAMTDCELLTINRNVFLDMVRANPRFAILLLGAVGNRARFVASMRT